MESEAGGGAFGGCADDAEFDDEDEAEDDSNRPNIGCVRVVPLSIVLIRRDAF